MNAILRRKMADRMPISRGFFALLASAGGARAAVRQSRQHVFVLGQTLAALGSGQLVGHGKGRFNLW
jgi:hypothetical protein